MRDPRLTRLAEVLVGYSLGVQSGQIVRITGAMIAEPLVTELYRSVLEAGGHPLVRMAPEQTSELFLKLASDDQISFVNPIHLYEVEHVDCSIHLWAEENTRALTNIDPRRVGQQQAARKPILDAFMRRAASGELRWTGTQYPTQASAQDAEMSLTEYEEFVFRAGLLDEADPVAAWRKLSVAQQRLTDYLNGKSDYRVWAPNGTDVRMSVANRRWINCDGHENFPDGEVFSGPVVGSVEGVIQFSFPAVHLGGEVQDARLTFREGKVVDAIATKGEAFLRSMLQTDAGASFLGECAIGTNYHITRYTKNTLFDEKIGGTVHFALGAGYPETGNTNVSGLHWDMVVDLRNGGFIEVDGVKISENGRFLLDGFPMPEHQPAGSVK